MKQLTFQVTPKSGNEQIALAIGTITLNVTLDGESYAIQIEPPVEPTVVVKLRTRGRKSIEINNIVMIRPPQDDSESKSNNKEIIVNGGYADMLCDFSVSKQMYKLFGDSIGRFVEVYRGCWINTKYITGIKLGEKAPFKGKWCVEVQYTDGRNDLRTEMYEISRRNLTKIKQIVNNK